MHLFPLFRQNARAPRLILVLALCIICIRASYSQTEDSTYIEPIRTWTYSPRATIVRPQAIDTMPESMHRLYPGLHGRTLSESLGQPGQPGRPVAIDKRTAGFDMPFIQPYSHYFFSYRDRIGYTTGQPFADMKYTSGSKKEQSINFLLTQNVNPYFNFGVRINYFASEGHFLRSHYAGKMVSAFATYRGSVQRAFINLNINELSQDENGGMKSNEYITDSLSVRFLEMEVNLNSATSKSNYHDISVLQEWNLLPGFTVLDSLLGDTDRFKLLIGQDFLYSYSARRYRETRSAASKAAPYYSSYYDTLRTSDLALTRILSQEAFGGFNQRFSRFVSVGARGGYGYEFEHSRYQDFLFLDPQTDFFSTFYTASFVGKIIGGYSWEANSKQYVTGYRGGDAILDAELSKTAHLLNDTVLFGASFGNKSVAPQLFYQQYMGNNFQWDNQFGKINSQTIRGEIADIRSRYSLSSYSALHSGYVYFGRDAQPQQYNSPLSELAVSGSVSYSLGKLHFKHSLTWQNSSQPSVLSIPAFVTENTAYFSSYAFSKLLYIVAGFDLSASSLYYAPRYMPATGIFYLQTDTESGLYPHTDVFVNCKLKRMRISVKYSQLGQIANRIADQKIIDRSPSTVDGYFYGKPHTTLSFAWFFHK